LNTLYEPCPLKIDQNITGSKMTIQSIYSTNASLEIPKVPHYSIPKVPSFVAIYNILDALPSNHAHLQMSLARYIINKHIQNHIRPLPQYPEINSSTS
jgi:hypothetical protein